MYNTVLSTSYNFTARPESVLPLFFQSDTSLLAKWFPSAVDYREIGTIAWLGGFAFILFKQFQNILANPLAKEFLTYLKLPDYGHHLGHIPVMRENIKKLARVRLEKFGKSKRLLYVVDDLDRCNQVFCPESKVLLFYPM